CSRVRREGNRAHAAGRRALPRAARARRITDRVARTTDRVARTTDHIARTTDCVARTTDRVLGQLLPLFGELARRRQQAHRLDLALAEVVPQRLPFPRLRGFDGLELTRRERYRTLAQEHPALPSG